MKKRAARKSAKLAVRKCKTRKPCAKKKCCKRKPDVARVIVQDEPFQADTQAPEPFINEEPDILEAL